MTQRLSPMVAVDSSTHHYNSMHLYVFMYEYVCWSSDELGAAAGTGKIQTLDDFDATFFNAHPKLADAMDPMMRIFVERSVEAIIDAGLNPTDLHGTNTAVFSGTSISDTDMFTYDMNKSGFTMLGRSKTMQANRVSYILHLTGEGFSQCEKSTCWLTCYCKCIWFVCV